jgi:hypothetical protein
MARQIKTTIDHEEGSLQIDVEGKDTIFITVEGLNASIQTHAILHGLKQKICDAAALPNGSTLTEKYLAMKEVFERITSADGTWNKPGEGNSQPTGLLFKALCRKYSNKTPDALRAWLDKQDKAKQAALRKNPEIAALIEAIRLESTKATGIDTDDLLSELNDI